MPKGVFLAYTNCVERGRDEEFNRWYTHTHLPDLLKAQGVVSARRFFNLNPGVGPSQYLALYEIESDDIQASIADLKAHARASFPKGGTSISSPSARCTRSRRSSRSRWSRWRWWTTRAAHGLRIWAAGCLPCLPLGEGCPVRAGSLQSLPEGGRGYLPQRGEALTRSGWSLAAAMGYGSGRCAGTEPADGRWGDER